MKHAVAEVMLAGATLASVAILLLYLNSDRNGRQNTCREIYSNLSGQIDSLRLTIDSARFFEKHDESAAIRGYYHTLIPKRVAQRNRYVLQRASLDCKVKPPPHSISIGLLTPP